MNNSPLVVYTKISPFRNSPRNHVIDTITIHCYVGQASVETAGSWFQKSNSSCNYMIGTDGRIALIVDERDRSWCSSNKENDNRAVTIECACDKTAPYAVNEKVWASLIALCADICKRNGIKALLWKADMALIGKVDQQNMTVHRWFKNKACPGEYLYSRHGQIAAEVNRLLNGGSTTAELEDPIKFPYQVRVKIPDLHIRKGAGTNYQKDGFTGKGVFTIVDETDGQISSTGKIGKWGLLKSGQKERNRWICLSLGTSVTEKL